MISINNLNISLHTAGLRSSRDIKDSLPLLPGGLVHVLSSINPLLSIMFTMFAVVPLQHWYRDIKGRYGAGHLEHCVDELKPLLLCFSRINPFKC